MLILRKIIEIVATTCHILKLKCTEIDFCWWCAPEPTVGVYSTPPCPYLDLRGPTCKRNEGRERKG